jgi:hypothetical protein
MQRGEVQQLVLRNQVKSSLTVKLLSGRSFSPLQCGNSNLQLNLVAGEDSRIRKQRRKQRDKFWCKKESALYDSPWKTKVLEVKAFSAHLRRFLHRLNRSYLGENKLI